MHRLLIVLLVSACQSAPQPEPALGVNSAAPTGAAVEDRAPVLEDATETFEFFSTEVQIDGAAEYIDESAKELGEGLVLLGRRAKRGILNLDTLEVTPLPAMIGDPTESPSITSAVRHGLVVASFEDKKAGVVKLQVLRLATMRWEEAGRFDIPKSRALAQEHKRLTSVWIRMVDDTLRLELTDEVDVKTSYVLDFETLVWSEVPGREVDHGPCLMSAVLEEDDRIRWGLGTKSKSETNGGPCVAVRATTDDEWRRIEDPSDEILFVRSAHVVDDRRFLITGGFKFSLFPFVNRADVVDVVAGEIRSLGKQAIGRKLDVPGEPFLWLAKDNIVRFDPQTEKFDRSPGPDLGFDPHWSFSVDERTVLFGGRDEDKEAHFVIAGFRAVQ